VATEGRLAIVLALAARSFYFDLPRMDSRECSMPRVTHFATGRLSLV
jgi:hypothetical protein